MKTWKTEFIVFGIVLVLSVISGMAYLSPIEVEDKCKPKKNAPDMQSDGVGWVERSETQQSNLSPTSIGDPKLDKAAFAQKTRKLQMPFIANNGQVDEQVRFYAKTFGWTVFVTKEGEIVYALPKTEKSECRLGEAERTQQAANPQSKNPSNSPNLKSETAGIALREEFIGARVKTIQGEDPSVTKVNYFKGSDPSKWKTNVSTYAAVSLGDVYDGIELSLKAYGNNVEKLFCVKPKSNPDQIKVQLSGAMSITVNEEGLLVAETEFGPVKFTKPIAYQEIDGKRVEVLVEYRIQDVGWVKRSAPNKNDLNDFNCLNRWNDSDGFASLNPSYTDSKNPNSEIQNSPSTEIGEPKSVYGFTVASYDKTKPLIIDPLLASTFLGGSDWELGYSLALDTSGNVYVTGYTWSADFPTTSGAYDTSYNGYNDVFVSKLNSGLTSLLASTYLGGSDWEWGNSLTLDTSGNVYATGRTGSADFPTTSGAYDTSYNGPDDVFVSKLDGNLSATGCDGEVKTVETDTGDFELLKLASKVVTGRYPMAAVVLWQM